MQQKTITTDILDIAYLEYGAPDGWPCIMGHGFPYDVNAYAETAPLIAEAGARVLVPWLRGYGPTRFRSAATLRSGEQAALGADLLAFMDALRIERAVVGGYDWGGRAACVVSVLHPERVIALVSGNSYNIQNIARAMEPASPAEEAALWYQYLFHNERGRRALERNRRGFARQPGWHRVDSLQHSVVVARHRPVPQARRAARRDGLRRGDVRGRSRRARDERRVRRALGAAAVGGRVVGLGLSRRLRLADRVFGVPIPGRARLADACVDVCVRESAGGAVRRLVVGQ